MPVNNAQQNRSWLYSAVLFLCIIQPCLDVISYWMDIWRADNTVTLALRFILLIMVIACAWSISDHKRVYGAMTLCSVLLIAGHVITCLRSFGQAYNLSWIFSDIANYFRVLQLPFFAMAMITAFRQAEDREELYDVMEKAFLINFIIILLVEKSISLPIILVAVIELAIFINLSIPFFTGNSLPFIAPICISTIQLGATVDYAILMTTRYKRERFLGHDKREAVITALSASIPSIVVSAMGLFAATVGVAVYSDVDMIGSLCKLLARGAIISMFSVILFLPAMFMLFDKVIGVTTLGFRPKSKEVRS